MKVRKPNRAFDTGSQCLNTLPDSIHVPDHHAHIRG
jgi:hypothetical protein